MELEIKDKRFGCLTMAMWIIMVFCAGMILISLGSCKSVQYVPVETIKHDSIYLSKIQHDSIYLQEYINVYQKADTVYKERIITKYKEKLLTDTVYVNKVDSVYQERIVEVEKKLTSWQESLMGMGKVFLVLMLAAVAYIAYRIYRKFSKL